MLIGDGEYKFTFCEDSRYTGRYVMSCTSKLIECFNYQKERADKLESQIESYKWIFNRLRVGDLDGAMCELNKLDKEG